MNERYDVIVAGAGLAGSLAAAMAAKGGANVVLLDRNKEEEVGKKTNWGWVCGDAVANDHLKFVTGKLGIKFDKPELDHKVEGVIAFSPDMKSKFRSTEKATSWTGRSSRQSCSSTPSTAALNTTRSSS